MASSEYQTTETCQPLEAIIMDWPEKPQTVAREIVAEYGLPDEAVPSMLIWHGNAPWTRTIVYRDESPHDFPESHTDLLEQSIRYKVPVEFVDDISAFNGSVSINRTKGEITAACDAESMNILSLNLVDDIVHGRITVQDARAACAVEREKFDAGEHTPMTATLHFRVGHGDTRDQDHHVSPRG